VGADAAVAVAVDVVLLSLARSGDDSRLVVLATRRRGPAAAADAEPVWALPGGRVADDEDLEAAAQRWLRDRGGVSAVRHLEQLATFGAPDRDPRGRVVSVSYLALLPEPVPAAPAAAWWPATGPQAAPGTAPATASGPPALAYDHDEILTAAVTRLRGKLTYSTVAYGLLPDAFTFAELQRAYEAVLGHRLDKRNFRKKVLALGMLDTAPGQRRGPHRPAQLYRFRRRGVALLDDVISTSPRT